MWVQELVLFCLHYFYFTSVLGLAMFLSVEGGGGPTVSMGRNLISRKEENSCIDKGLLSARCSCVRGG